MMKTLLKTKKTVFTKADMQQLFAKQKEQSLSHALLRKRDSGDLLNPRKGIRTLPVFDVDELACKLYPGCYISLESVLYEAGVVFQRYGSSTRVVRNNTRSFTFQEHDYIARKIKDVILYDDTGVRIHGNKRIATPERALCDMVYLRPDPQLDNPEHYHTRESRSRFKKLLPLYPKTVQTYVQKLLLREI